MNKLLLPAIIVLSSFFAGCVQTPTDQSKTAANQPAKSDKKIKIGFSMDTLKEHWVKDKELVEKRAAELGADVVTNVAESNDERQLQQIDDFITQGVDVLVIAPHNGQVMATAVDKAKAKGIPVVSYDRLILSDKIDVLVSHLHSLAGQMQADYALKNAPKGKYVMIYGAPTDQNALLMKENQLATLKPAVDRGDVQIVTEQHAKNWSPEDALKIAENALTQNQNQIVAFVCSNDGTASGAIQALKKQNLAGKVIVTGMDAELSALQRIADGEQSMTVYKPIKPLAYAAVEAAVKLARGEKLETTKTMKAVDREVPFIFIEPKIVDKSNLLDVVNDGAEKYEDIFIHVPENQRPKKP
ncbi:MAG: substrate-binding domain-containing protein [Acidobacteria bacterium]|nr:substrate-binding domain-containing protein [Acidobacteriota bacterium]